MPIQKSKDVSVDLNKAGDRLGIIERKNFKTICYYVSVIIILYISIVEDFAKKMATIFFDHHLWFFYVLAILIFGLVIIRSIQIFKQKGISAIHTSDDKFLGEVGHLVIEAVSILIASYTGMVVLGLIILGKFPEEVPKEGLPFIFLSMLYFWVWSGHEISKLIRQILTGYPTNPPIKEITTIKNITTDIIYCSGLTADEIKQKYRPKTKDDNWYNEHCIRENNIPECAVKGHRGGTPFYTKDNKIMRSGPATWHKLDIKQCLE